MISERDVVRIRVPFPNIDSGLAVRAHMYICKENSNARKKLIKSQTFKLNLIDKINNYIIEEVDAKRNPYKNKTIIDLDKIFKLEGVLIPLNLRTTIRPDISKELYDIILKKLDPSANEEIINAGEFLTLNYKCTRV